MEGAATTAAHEAIQGLLEEGELAVSWVCMIDVARPDGGRYLAHRSGGGIDGQEPPMGWAAIGMFQSGLRVAEAQLLDYTDEVEDEDGG